MDSNGVLWVVIFLLLVVIGYTHFYYSKKWDELMAQLDVKNKSLSDVIVESQQVINNQTKLSADKLAEQKRALAKAIEEATTARAELLKKTEELIDQKGNNKIKNVDLLSIKTKLCLIGDNQSDCKDKLYVEESIKLLDTNIDAVMRGLIEYYRINGADPAIVNFMQKHQKAFASLASKYDAEIEKTIREYLFKWIDTQLNDFYGDVCDDLRNPRTKDNIVRNLSYDTYARDVNGNMYQIQLFKAMFGTSMDSDDGKVIIQFLLDVFEILVRTLDKICGYPRLPAADLKKQVQLALDRVSIYRKRFITSTAISSVGVINDIRTFDMGV